MDPPKNEPNIPRFQCHCGEPTIMVSDYPGWQYTYTCARPQIVQKNPKTGLIVKSKHKPCNFTKSIPMKGDHVYCVYSKTKNTSIFDIDNSDRYMSNNKIDEINLFEYPALTTDNDKNFFFVAKPINPTVLEIKKENDNGKLKRLVKYLQVSELYTHFQEIENLCNEYSVNVYDPDIETIPEFTERIQETFDDLFGKKTHY